MDTEKTESDVVDTSTNEGEGETEVLSIPKKDYETLNQTLGSLKRELKDLKKAKEETKEVKETPKNQPDENKLLVEKAYLRSAQITAEDEVELALSTAKKWDMSIDKLVDDEDFKVKLEKLRTSKTNTLATSNIRGSAGNSSQAKDTPEHWLAIGRPPTATEVPDRKIRAKVLRAFMAEEKGTGKNPYYNG